MSRDEGPDWVKDTRERNFSWAPENVRELAQYYPTATSEGHLFRLALADTLRKHRQGVTPEDIYQDFTELVGEAGGAVPVTVVERDGEQRLAVDGGKGERVVEMRVTDDVAKFVEMDRAAFEEHTREEMVEMLEAVRDAIDEEPDPTPDI